MIAECAVAMVRLVRSPSSTGTLLRIKYVPGLAGEVRFPFIINL